MAGVSFLLGGGWEVGRAVWTRGVGACHPRGFGSMYAPLIKIIKIFKMRFSEMNSLGSKLCVDVCMLLFCSIASFLGFPLVSLQEEGEGLVHVNVYRDRQRKGGGGRRKEQVSVHPSTGATKRKLTLFGTMKTCLSLSLQLETPPSLVDINVISGQGLPLHCCILSVVKNWTVALSGKDWERG